VPEHATDLEARVLVLEQQMVIVTSKGQQTRAIVRRVDRDVAELSLKLDGHIKVLNALRETQLEHGEKLREHDARFDRLEIRFDGLEREMRNGFSTLAVGMAQITALLTSPGSGRR